MFLMLASEPNKIDFLGIEVAISTFLIIAIGIALLIFFILLAVLLIMYLRKKISVRGFIPYSNEESYKLEETILQIEKEITEIQNKFYLNYQSKKQKKFLSKK